MATFISTLKFTEQGLKNIQDTIKRANAFKAAAKKLGAKVVEVYWTMGAFDGVIVLEAPDEEVASAAMLQLAVQGNVQPRTVRAFGAAEMQKLLAKTSA